MLVLSNVRTADPDLQSQSQVKINLTPETPEKVIIVVKTVKDAGRDSVKVGSISIPQDLFVNSGDSKHVQWITLFDHLDDDEYDGDFTESDEEMPRVKFMFVIEKVVELITPTLRTSQVLTKSPVVGKGVQRIDSQI